MTDKINCLVVDDEPLAREGLMMYAEQVDFLKISGVCGDALEANQHLTENSTDLIFLDIQMPKITGIDFLKAIKNPPMIILTTAYPNFALQGYELDVMDYLVKPYSFERFLKAANKARDFQTLKQSLNSRPVQEEDYFFVKCDHRFEKIHFNDVLYVNGMENYVVIHTNERKYMTLMRMKTMEDILPASGFMRIHKSYIASVNAITAIDGNELVIGSARLPLSRELKNDILKRLLKN